MRIRSASTVFDIIACCSGPRLYQASSRTSFTILTALRSSWTGSLWAMKYPPRWLSNAEILIEERDYILATRWRCVGILDAARNGSECPIYSAGCRRCFWIFDFDPRSRRTLGDRAAA